MHPLAGLHDRRRTSQAVSEAASRQDEIASPAVCLAFRLRAPATARINQFDYVFASRGFHRSLKVRAMNGVDEWGPSDHCRLLIEIGE